jgi:transcriptional regulator with XRE-family HTH domain
VSRKEDLLQRKADAERMIAEGIVMEEYQAYLPEATEDEELAFHYFMRDTILEFKKLRKQKGITQAVLASRMRTKQTAVSRFESYNGAPSLQFLNKYALALGEKLNSLALGGVTLSIPEDVYALAKQVYGDDPIVTKNNMLETIIQEVKSRYEYKTEMLEAFSSAEPCGTAEWNQDAFSVQVTS